MVREHLRQRPPAQPANGRRPRELLDHLQPTGEVERIYDASVRYQAAGTPLVIPSAARSTAPAPRATGPRGTQLLGIKAVLVESFSRAHPPHQPRRHGRAPLAVPPRREPRHPYGLDGSETFDILGISDGLQPGMHVTVRAHKANGVVEFKALARVDTPLDVTYYRHGSGILALRHPPPDAAGVGVGKTRHQRGGAGSPAAAYSASFVWAISAVETADLPHSTVNTPPPPEGPHLLPHGDAPTPRLLLQ
ncbi:MAG: hypothetical protein U0232_14815 [Thermomicrobiales bacterium]